VLITELQDVFATSDGDFGGTDRLYHRSNIGDALPIRQPSRRLPLAKQAEVNDILNDMKAKTVVEESDSSWASPVVLNQKMNGDLRFCVDYRKPNDVTKEDFFQLCSRPSIYSGLHSYCS
jgi:hypothetical protein